MTIINDAIINEWTSPNGITPRVKSQEQRVKSQEQRKADIESGEALSSLPEKTISADAIEIFLTMVGDREKGFELIGEAVRAIKDARISQEIANENKKRKAAHLNPLTPEEERSHTTRLGKQHESEYAVMQKAAKTFSEDIARANGR